MGWIKKKLGNEAGADAPVPDSAPAAAPVTVAETVVKPLPTAPTEGLADELAACNARIAREPSAGAYYGRGIVHCKLGKFPEAIADLDEALARRPRYAGALTERGLARMESKDFERALADYDAAIAIDPSYAIAHENKGLALLHQQRWAEAIPCLDAALRLTPSKASLRYHRGLAHEQLGDLARARRDLQDSVRFAPQGEHVRFAKQRLADVVKRAAGIPEPAEPAPESLWLVLTGISLDDTVAELVRRVHTEASHVVQIDLADGSPTFAVVHGPYGLRRRLTELTDAIGPRILTLQLGQIDRLFEGPPGEANESPPPPGVEQQREGAAIHILHNAGQLIGAFLPGAPYIDLDLPTALFGAQPSFDRSAGSEHARRCTACGGAFGYFEAVLTGDQLTGYACPRCAADPTVAWIERRMRPGSWSRGGFLGPDEALADVLTRDDQTLARLGVSHAALADALDRLLAAAFAASTEQLAAAARRTEAEQRASGQRGHEGLAVLPLGATLDEIEADLRAGRPLPAQRGIRVSEHDVVLQVYQGYQYCPFSKLLLPWSDSPPLRRIHRHLEAGVAYLSEPLDRQLPCRAELTYRFANLEFLIVHRPTRALLRGAGLLVHLLRDHRFFEGEHSPFRLDPELAARVLLPDR